MTGLIEAILVNILIPEIAGILRKKPDATDAEVIAEMETRRASIIAKGQQFLSETQ
jgi:hypothetical protein